MRTLFVPIAAVLLIAVSVTPEAAPEQSAPTPAPSIGPSSRALLDRYCLACHNDKLRTAGLTLEKVDLEQVGPSAEVWEKVLRKLRAGAMPPAGRPRPAPAERAQF